MDDRGKSKYLPEGIARPEKGTAADANYRHFRYLSHGRKAKIIALHLLPAKEDGCLGARLTTLTF
jgi:hypothetical protein